MLPSSSRVHSRGQQRASPHLRDTGDHGTPTDTEGEAAPHPWHGEHMLVVDVLGREVAHALGRERRRSVAATRTRAFKSAGCCGPERTRVSWPHAPRAAWVRQGWRPPQARKEGRHTGQNDESGDSWTSPRTPRSHTPERECPSRPTECARHAPPTNLRLLSLRWDFSQRCLPPSVACGDANSLPPRDLRCGALDSADWYSGLESRAVEGPP